MCTGTTLDNVIVDLLKLIKFSILLIDLFLLSVFLPLDSSLHTSML